MKKIYKEKISKTRSESVKTTKRPWWGSTAADSSRHRKRPGPWMIICLYFSLTLLILCVYLMGCCNSYNLFLFLSLRRLKNSSGNKLSYPESSKFVFVLCFVTNFDLTPVMLNNIYISCRTIILWERHKTPYPYPIYGLNSITAVLLQSFVSLFYGISIFVGYSMPNTSL